MSSNALPAFCSAAVRSGLLAAISLGRAVVDPGELELGVVQAVFGLVLRLDDFGPLRLPAGQFGGAATASSRVLNFASACWNFSRASAKARPRIGQASSLLRRVLALEGLRRADQFLRCFIRKSPHSAMAVAAAGLSGFSLRNFAKCLCDSSISRS